MRSLRLVAFLAIPAQLAFAQQTPAPRGQSLSLQDAVATAQQNNPAYQQVKNSLRDADAAVRTTYGALLPTASANMGTRYTQGGTQYQFGLPFATPASYNSFYGLTLNYNVSAGMLYAPKAAKANRSASEADIANYSALLRQTVTQQYISALQNDALAAVLDTLVTVAQGQLDLATAKMKVGAGTIIDVRTAEVALGQAQVNALNAHNQARVNKLQLFQTMGVPADIDAKLTTQFSVAEPTFSLDSLIALAHRVNPDLLAKKSRETAAEANVKLAKTSYLPSLSLSTGYSANSFGYSNSDLLAQQAAASAASSFKNCMLTDSIRVGAGLAPVQCGSGTLSAEELDAARAQNQPFKFTRSPYNVSAFISIPVFSGFQREQNLEQQRVARDNAQNDVRARNLQITTDVTQAFLTLETDAKTVELQTQIANKAAEDLALNEESYKVGAKTFLDVTTARGTYEKAQIDRVNAIYEYHKAFAALENAVGRPLR